VLKVSPPLVIGEAELKDGLGIVAAAIRDAKEKRH
jgi:4-aminobutyrate aminotransferase-like enzyme